MSEVRDQRPALRRWLSDPLVHFLLIGALFFAVYSAFEPGREAGGGDAEINLTTDDVLAMWSLFESQWRRPPTADEFGQMIENKVREEVLYREALAMGLDQDDSIVKRRMAQKMQFLAEDVAEAYNPDDTELRAWYELNADKFTLPGRISFRQIYFSPDQRGTRTFEDARQALSLLADRPVDSVLAADMGDPFVLQDYYADRTSVQIAKEFGPVFAQAMVRTDEGVWYGPIESGFGWHLVYIDSLVPGRQPEFSEIAPDVKTAWLGMQKALAWQEAYDKMRSKYTVVVPVLPEDSDILQAVPEDTASE